MLKAHPSPQPPAPRRPPPAARRPPPDERVIARRRQVGEQIRRVREHHDLTQTDVCGRSGIDIATYSRIEQGHASPLLGTLIRIADAIGGELAEVVK